MCPPSNIWIFEYRASWSIVWIGVKRREREKEKTWHKLGREILDVGQVDLEEHWEKSFWSGKSSKRYWAWEREICLQILHLSWPGESRFRSACATSKRPRQRNAWVSLTHLLSETVIISYRLRTTAALRSRVKTRGGGGVQQQTGVPVSPSDDMSRSAGSHVSSHSRGTPANVIARREYTFELVTTG